MKAKLKAVISILVVLLLLAAALYLPSIRPVRVNGISEGPSEHVGTDGMDGMAPGPSGGQ